MEIGDEEDKIIADPQRIPDEVELDEVEEEIAEEIERELDPVPA